MKEKPIETIRYKGIAIEIYPDFDPMNPRTEWDNFSHMVCWHRRYDLGDKDHGFAEPDDFREWWKANGKGGIIFPLRLYDHSGITISASTGYPYNDGWDSMMVGWCYVTAEDIRKNYMVKRVTGKIRERARELVLGEIDVYDDYLRGNVYGYNLEYPDGGEDSCWGFYGYDHEKSGLLSEARGAIDGHIRWSIRKHLEQLRKWIMNHVPLEYRNPAPRFEH